MSVSSGRGERVLSGQSHYGRFSAASRNIHRSWGQTCGLRFKVRHNLLCLTGLCRIAYDHGVSTIVKELLDVKFYLRLINLLEA